MFQGMNPKQMQRMMEQMGIKNKEIKAERVIIEKEDGQLIITEPQVVEITMQGQRSFQIVGKVEEKNAMKEDDVKLVMEKTGASRERVEQALDECKGDIAEAIMKLQG
ncbi:MAG: nascent polypeptide-associated complex protein [Candidatus Micrarchaeota archaeon]|nr:nascent polypeptide-associated complex protein [Candidatus Micrarchaeota archaeon]